MQGQGVFLPGLGVMPIDPERLSEATQRELLASVPDLSPETVEEYLGRGVTDMATGQLTPEAAAVQGALSKALEQLAQEEASSPELSEEAALEAEPPDDPPADQDGPDPHQAVEYYVLGRDAGEVYGEHRGPPGPAAGL